MIVSKVWAQSIQSSAEWFVDVTTYKIGQNFDKFWHAGQVDNHLPSVVESSTNGKSLEISDLDVSLVTFQLQTR